MNQQVPEIKATTMVDDRRLYAVGSRWHVSLACGWKDRVNQQVPEIKATTMFDDRRLYVAGTEKFRILEEPAIEYTKNRVVWRHGLFEDVGNKFNDKKSTVATSLMSEQTDIMKIATRQKLKHVTSDKQVGCQLSQGKQRNREVQNERAAKATITISRNLHDQKHLHF